MQSTPEDMDKVRDALLDGEIPRAYRLLLGYTSDLSRHFQRKYPKSSVSALNQGYLDMTYFAVMPPALKRHGLKIAVDFNHEAFRSEARFPRGSKVP